MSITTITIPEGSIDLETAEPFEPGDATKLQPRILPSGSGVSSGFLGLPLDEFANSSSFFSPQVSAEQSSKLSAECFEEAKKLKASGKYTDKSTGEVSAMLFSKRVHEIVSTPAAISQPTTQVTEEPVGEAVVRKGKLSLEPSPILKDEPMPQPTKRPVKKAVKKKVIVKKATKKKAAKKKVAKKKPVKKKGRFQQVADQQSAPATSLDAMIQKAVDQFEIEGLQADTFSDPEMIVTIRSHEPDNSISEDEIPVDWALTSPAGSGRQLILILDRRRAVLGLSNFSMRPDRKMQVSLKDLESNETYEFSPIQVMYGFEFGIFQFITMFEDSNDA